MYVIVCIWVFGREDFKMKKKNKERLKTLVLTVSNL
jgi:hypothetical protein